MSIKVIIIAKFAISQTYKADITKLILNLLTTTTSTAATTYSLCILSYYY
jgi:hypothetical protein